MDDPLKGLLMDKGAGQHDMMIERQLIRRMNKIYDSMIVLINDFTIMKKNYGVDFFDLSVERRSKPGPRDKFDPEAYYYLEWFTRPDLRGLCEGDFAKRRRRAHPFDETHSATEQIQDAINANCPAFLPVLIAYDDVRGTLNISYRVARLLYFESRKNRTHESKLDVRSCRRVSSTMSKEILARIDQTSPIVTELAGVMSRAS